MPSQWQVSSRSSVGAPAPPPVVASYSATTSVVVIRSSWHVTDSLTAGTRRRLIASPGYAQWPPFAVTSRGLVLPELDDSLLLLLRLKLAFDFGAGITANSPYELSKGIDAEWPALAVPREELARGAGIPPYEQASINGEVNALGEPTWGYTRNVNGGQLLPLKEPTPVPARPEFDRFLQNLVRVDLARRIDAQLA
jgi:hypothetical protein